MRKKKEESVLYSGPVSVAPTKKVTPTYTSSKEYKIDPNYKTNPEYLETGTLSKKNKNKETTYKSSVQPTSNEERSYGGKIASLGSLEEREEIAKKQEKERQARLKEINKSDKNKKINMEANRLTEEQKAKGQVPTSSINNMKARVTTASNELNKAMNKTKSKLEGSGNPISKTAYLNTFQNTLQNTFLPDVKTDKTQEQLDQATLKRIEQNEKILNDPNKSERAKEKARNYIEAQKKLLGQQPKNIKEQHNERYAQESQGHIGKSKVGNKIAEIGGNLVSGFMPIPGMGGNTTFNNVGRDVAKMGGTYAGRGIANPKYAKLTENFTKNALEGAMGSIATGMMANEDPDQMLKNMAFNSALGGALGGGLETYFDVKRMKAPDTYSNSYGQRSEAYDNAYKNARQNPGGFEEYPPMERERLQRMSAMEQGLAESSRYGSRGNAPQGPSMPNIEERMAKTRQDLNNANDFRTMDAMRREAIEQQPLGLPMSQEESLMRTREAFANDPANAEYLKNMEQESNRMKEQENIWNEAERNATGEFSPWENPNAQPWSTPYQTPYQSKYENPYAKPGASSEIPRENIDFWNEYNAEENLRGAWDEAERNATGRATEWQNPYTVPGASTPYQTPYQSMNPNAMPGAKSDIPINDIMNREPLALPPASQEAIDNDIYRQRAEKIQQEAQAKAEMERKYSEQLQQDSRKRMLDMFSMAEGRVNDKIKQMTRGHQADQMQIDRAKEMFPGIEKSIDEALAKRRGRKPTRENMAKQLGYDYQGIYDTATRELGPTPSLSDLDLRNQIAKEMGYDIQGMQKTLRQNGGDYTEPIGPMPRNQYFQQDEVNVPKRAFTNDKPINFDKEGANTPYASPWNNPNAEPWSSPVDLSNAEPWSSPYQTPYQTPYASSYDNPITKFGAKSEWQNPGAEPWSTPYQTPYQTKYENPYAKPGAKSDLNVNEFYNNSSSQLPDDFYKSFPNPNQYPEPIGPNLMSRERVQQNRGDIIQDDIKLKNKKEPKFNQQDFDNLTKEINDLEQEALLYGKGTSEYDELMSEANELKNQYKGNTKASSGFEPRFGEAPPKPKGDFEPRFSKEQSSITQKQRTMDMLNNEMGMDFDTPSRGRSTQQASAKTETRSNGTGEYNQSRNGRNDATRGQYGREDIRPDSEILHKNQTPKRKVNPREPGNTKFASETIYKNPNVSDEVLEELEKSDLSYETHNNKQTLSKVNEDLKQGKLIDHANDLVNKFNDNKYNMKPYDYVKAQVVGLQLSRNNEPERAAEMFKLLSQNAKTSGQLIQTLANFSKMTPEGALKFFDKEYKLASGKNDFIPKDLREMVDSRIQDISKIEDTEKRAKEFAKLMRDFKEKTPRSFTKATGDMWQSWNMISMLANPKTMIRNILGNDVMGRVDTFSEQGYGKLVDKLIGLETGKRTISSEFGSKAKADRKASKEIAKKNAKKKAEWIKEGIDPTNLNMRAQGGNFRSKPMKTIERALNYGLNVPDEKAVSYAYERSLRNQMRANGAKKPTQEMMDIAMQEAMERTYKDDNWASKISTGLQQALDKPTGNLKLGSKIIPFAKTPANVLKRGMEYTPLGIAEGLYKLNKMYKGGPNAPTQRDVSRILGRGLTGTTALVPGMYLADNGILQGQLGGDKQEQNYRREMGEMANSLKIPTQKGTLNLDVSPLAPAITPLLTGANIQENINQGMGQGEALAKAIGGSTFGALKEMPFVQGLTDFLNLMNGDVEIPEYLGSVASQSIPTLSGQIARFTDKTQADTSNDPNPITARLKAKVPGLSNTVANRVNFLTGEEKKNSVFDNQLMRGLDIFLNPFNMNIQDNPNAEQYYNTVKDEGLDPTKYLPNRLKNNLSATKDYPAINLKGEDYKKYNQQYGKEINKLMDSYNRDPEAFQKALEVYMNGQTGLEYKEYKTNSGKNSKKQYKKGDVRQYYRKEIEGLRDRIRREMS